MYNNENYKKRLQFMINSFIFLFVGVSFNDIFVREFFEENKNIFRKNTHYILFSDKEIVEDEQDFKSKYGLNIIRYETENGFVCGLRTKLQEMFGQVLLQEDQQPTNAKVTIINNAKNAPIIHGGSHTFHFS